MRTKFFEHKWPAILLWPLAFLYCLITQIRNIFYDIGLLRQYRLDCTVICVGNILVGGTGKTPTVLYLARWLESQGKRVAILSRGYGRQGSHRLVVADEEGIHARVDQSGDEPYLLAQCLKSVPIVVDSDRVAGGRFLIEHYDPDVILMDDGFQHRRLAHDYDILTFQRSSVFGNGFCLPAGPLRESTKRLSRANLLWFNGPDIGKSDYQKYPSIPRIDAFYKVDGIIDGQNEYNVAEMRAQKIVAFCGLAQPDSFFSTLETLDFQILGKRVFKDHHSYDADDMAGLEKWRSESSADWIITTLKDWVKLPSDQMSEKWGYLSVSVWPIDENRAEMILNQMFRI